MPGWIATYCGLAGGADIILVPEEPFDIEKVCERLRRRHDHGAAFSIVVVAEGAVPVEGTMTMQSGDTDEFGHVRLGGIGYAPARRDRDSHRLRGAGHGARTICCAAAHPPRSTASSRPSSASRRSTPCNEHDFATMVALARNRRRARADRAGCRRVEDRRCQHLRSRGGLLRVTRAASDDPEHRRTGVPSSERDHDDSSR